MLWLPVLLASHPSLDAGVGVAELSAPQPHDLAIPDATMRLPADPQSGLLVSDALPVGRALSQVCGACSETHYFGGAASCCDQVWQYASQLVPAQPGWGTCAFLSGNYQWDCSGCNCPGDPPPSPPSLPSPPSPRRTSRITK